MSLPQIAPVEGLRRQRAKVKQVRLCGVQLGGEAGIAEAGGVIGHGLILYVVTGAGRRQSPVGPCAGDGCDPRHSGTAEDGASIDRLHNVKVGPLD